MIVKSCPTCHRNGFLTFRKIRKWTRPYIGHYDSIEYQKQKFDYENGLRHSRPTGRKWCSITKFEAKGLDFEDIWYVEYMKKIQRIYQKYKEFGFKDPIFLKDIRRVQFKQILKEFITFSKWKDDWNDAKKILKTNGYSEELLDDKIRYDLFSKTNKLQNFRDEVLLFFGLMK